MPRIWCPGGHSFSISEIPHSRGFHLAREPELDEFMDKMYQIFREADDEKDFARRAYQLIYSDAFAFLQAYECPECKRLLVFAKASDETVSIAYKAEVLDNNATDLVNLVIHRKSSPTS